MATCGAAGPLVAGLTIGALGVGTEQSVRNTVDAPYTTRNSTNLAENNPATAYYVQDGSHVIVDDVTKEVIQVSDRTRTDWIPDRNIIDPYMP